jgi:endonuclease/exonuclease/phosphatase family metal-dependent hydrolase
MRRLLPVLLTVLGCVSGPEFTVMSFNIRYGTAADGENAWEHRRDLLAATIIAQDPDILGLQEALRFQLDELGAALRGHVEIGVGRDDGVTAGEYAALLIRRERFDVDTSGTFWLSDTPETPGSMSWGNRITRICTWAILRDRTTGSRLGVFNTHLDHESQPARERGAALILDQIGRLARDVPVLILGDFNSGEDNPALTPLREAGFLDTYRVVDPDPAGDGTFGEYRGDSTGAKIDYILARGGWTVQSADILRRRRGARDPSDHFPVVARLRAE